MVSGLVTPTIVPLRVNGNYLEDAKSKFDVDTNTPFELKSPDKDVEIYYTTNGATPEHRNQSALSKFTQKYDKPFYLPAGKYLIKAIAVSPNRQQTSSVNSKLFRVSHGSRQRRMVYEDDDYMFMKQLHKSDFDEMNTQINRSAVLRNMSSSVSNSVSVPNLVTSRQNCSTKYRDDSIGSFCSACGFNEFRGSKFCSNCGHSIVSVSVPPSGNVLRRDVGLHVSSINVRSSISASHTRKCPGCKLSVSEFSCYCDSCGMFLNQDPRTLVNNISGWPGKSQKLSKFCSTCGHENSPNDLYCFKCGLELKSIDPPSVKQAAKECSLCCKDNPANSRFCLSCGSLLLNSSNMDQGKSHKMNVLVSSDWEPVIIPMAKLTLKNSVATQTAGLFYPVGTEMSNGLLNRRGTADKRQEFKDEKRMLTQRPKESPGKGLWNENAAFMQTVLQEYIENSPESRVKLSQMKLKGLKNLEIERNDEKTATFILSFSVSKRDSVQRDGKRKEDKEARSKDSPSPERKSSRQRRSLSKKKDKKKPDKKPRDSSSDSSSSKSTTSSRSSSSSESKSSRKTSGKSNSIKSKVKKGDEKSLEKSMKPMDRLLLNAVRNKESLDLVKQYIDEGADVNLSAPSGDTLISLAVRVVNEPVISILYQMGADVNAMGGNGETPLHVAISCDNPDADIIRKLLECHANPGKKNDRGKSVLDVASELDVDKKIVGLLRAAGERPGSASVVSTRLRKNPSVASTSKYSELGQRSMDYF